MINHSNFEHKTRNTYIAEIGREIGITMSSFFQYSKAICREIPQSLVSEAQRINEPEVPINYELASEQHQKYVSTLTNLGLEVTVIPSDESLPDSCFVEDPAVICGNKVLLTNLGHPSRRGETKAIRDILEKFQMEIIQMIEPAMMDGGDVLFTGHEFFAGLTKRTNQEGIQFLRDTFQNYSVHEIVIENGEVLHLKSMMSMAGDDLIAIGKSHVAKNAMQQMQTKAARNYSFLELPDDNISANCLFINGTLIHRPAEEFPDSAKIYGTLKCPKIELPASEIRKVDGAFTCCSLLF